MIENSRFTPGARINVEDLTLEMGVSRTPIWQAIGQLEKEGLLYSIPNKGVFMQELSPKEAVDLYSVREVLECMAAELASAMIDEGTIGRMEANLAEQRKAIESGDLVAYSKLDFDFHFACTSPRRTLSGRFPPRHKKEDEAHGPADEHQYFRSCIRTISPFWKR